MKIATITCKDQETKEYILILSKKEGQNIVKILTEYCEQNKKKKIAHEYLKELYGNLPVF